MKRFETEVMNYTTSILVLVYPKCQVKRALGKPRADLVS